MALLYKGNKLISVLNKVEILNGLTKVDSLPDNNYDTRGVYEIPYNFDDVYINIKINSTDDLEKRYNVSGLLSKLFRIPITGTEVVDTLPTENIIESPYNNGFYLYYSKADNDIFLYIQSQGWINIGSCDQTFKTLLMSCKGFINTELDDVVLEHGYYAVNTKDYYKYFEHWEEVEYTGDGSDLIDTGYNLPEKNIDKDKVYRIKYFDDVYMILKEGSTGSYLSEELLVMCGIDVCDDFPTKNLVSPSSDSPVYQHFYYIKNKGLYVYSDEAKQFASFSEAYDIPFKGELDKNNNNATEMGMYAVYTYKYYRSTTSATRFKYNSQELNVTPSTEEQTFEATGNDYYSKVIVSPVTSDVDSNIVPENIAKDVTILGVTGTLKEGIDGITLDDGNLLIDKDAHFGNTTVSCNTYLGITENCTDVYVSAKQDTDIEITAGNVNIYYSGTPTITADNLLPENIKSGVDILGVEGNATIIDGVTYEDSCVVIIDNYDTCPYVSIQSQTDEIYVDNDCANCWFEGNYHSIISLLDGYEAYITCDGNSIVKAENLSPENIRKGTTILGYTGTYAREGTTTVKNLLDDLKHTKNFFNEYQGTSIEGLIEYDDTSNVTDMSYMFYSCSNLTSIPELNTSNVTNMSAMFSGCYELSTIPKLNTSNVTDMSDMFRNCRNLSSIPDINFDNVTNMESCFYNCYKLESIDIKPINATRFATIFSGCNYLKNVKIDTRSGTVLNGMFYGCNKLESIKLNTSNANTYTNMFYNCCNLKIIDFSHFYCGSSSSNTNLARNCSSLTKFIIRNMDSVTPLYSTTFTGCYHFTGTVNSTYNPDGLKDGRIYVPDDMVDTLKAATNWSTYADIIVGLSTLEE
jgi:surface protein